MGKAKPTTFMIKAVALFFGLLLVATNGWSKDDEKNGFEAGKYIIHHVADSHSIHLFGDEKDSITEVSIPLPVILWTNNGLTVFMSSKFHHDEEGKVVVEANGQRFVNYHDKIAYATETPNEFGSYVALDDQKHAVFEELPLDFSITKSVFGMLLIMALMTWLFVSVGRAYTRRKGQAPTGLQNAMEPLILFVKDDVIIPSIGAKKADKFVPFLLTTFFFIWMCNMLGLIPFLGGFNITGTLGVTAVLAAFVFIITSVSGNKHYWGHILWPPGVPLPIKFILVPIEVVGVFLKPLVLMIRLTANITAGHIVILAFVSLVVIFGQNSVGLGYGVGVGAVAFMVFMFFLELLVAFLQAYVFTMLAALYFGDATQDAHH